MASVRPGTHYLITLTRTSSESNMPSFGRETFISIVDISKTNTVALIGAGIARALLVRRRRSVAKMAVIDNISKFMSKKEEQRH